MNHNGDRDKHLIEQLNQLPKIEDKRSKEEIYQRISSAQHTKKSHKIFPVLGLVTAVAILFFMIAPSIMDRNQQEMSDKSVNDVKQFNQESKEESGLGLEGEEQDMAGQGNILEKQDSSTVNSSLVVNETESSDQLVYAAVAEKQMQYIIPLTFIVPDSSVNEAYNQLDQLIATTNQDNDIYLFRDIKYQFDEENNQVSLNLPNGFSLGNGTATAGMFQRMLAVMFQPYQIERVKFTGNLDNVDFDEMGRVKEMSIKETKTFSYKLYDQAAQKRLIQVPNEEHETIVDAINKLKTSEESYHVERTIPKDMQFSIHSNDQSLRLEFRNDSSLTNNEEGITMIESILMTAKSYGYVEVQFENASIERVGEYDLTKPIPVPVAANPIKK
ncbi:MAG: hypothetical protein ACQEWU_14930 [Bacillota bacterium]